MNLYAVPWKNVLDWCHSVSIRVVFLLWTIQQTSWLRPMLSQIQVAALQRWAEKLEMLVECSFPLRLVFSCTQSRSNFPVRGVYRLICAHPDPTILSLIRYTLASEQFHTLIRNAPIQCLHVLLPAQELPVNNHRWHHPNISSSFQDSFVHNQEVISGTSPAISSTACNWSFSLSCPWSAFRIAKGLC